MHVLVLGAGGKVGQLVVGELMNRNYTVRAFVHSEPSHRLKGVEYVTGDVRSADDMRRALDGIEAVISTLGSWGTKSKDILSTGMQIVVPMMEERSIARIISLTGADAWSKEDYANLGRAAYNPFAIYDGKPMIMRSLSHGLFSLIANKIIFDSEAHIRVLAESSLEWTVIRSPVMNNKGQGKYDVSSTYPYPWATIHRQAVAKAMCDQLQSVQFVGRLPYLHRA